MVFLPRHRSSSAAGRTVPARRNGRCDRVSAPGLCGRGLQVVAATAPPSSPVAPDRPPACHARDRVVAVEVSGSCFPVLSLLRSVKVRRVFGGVPNNQLELLRGLPNLEALNMCSGYANGNGDDGSRDNECLRLPRLPRRRGLNLTEAAYRGDGLEGLTGLHEWRDRTRATLTPCPSPASGRGEPRWKPAIPENPFCSLSAPLRFFSCAGYSGFKTCGLTTFSGTRPERRSTIWRAVRWRRLSSASTERNEACGVTITRGSL